MGLFSSGKKSKVKNKVEIPAEYQAFLDDILSRTGALGDQEFRTMDPSERILGQNAEQLAAQQAARGTLDLAQPYVNQAMQTAQIAQQRLSSAPALNMLAGQYMDPYLDDVLGYSRDIAFDDYERSLASLQAGQAGSFGGSRQAVQEAELARGFNKDMMGLTYNARSDAYNMALDRSRQQNIDSLESARSLFDLGRGYQGSELEDARTMYNIGSVDQRIQQGRKDFEFGELQREQAFDRGLVQDMANIGYAYPTQLFDTKQVSRAPEQSTFNKALGAASGALGLFQSAVSPMSWIQGPSANLAAAAQAGNPLASLPAGAMPAGFAPSTQLATGPAGASVPGAQGAVGGVGALSNLGRSVMAAPFAEGGFVEFARNNNKQQQKQPKGYFLGGLVAAGGGSALMSLLPMLMGNRQNRAEGGYVKGYADGGMPRAGGWGDADQFDTDVNPLYPFRGIRKALRNLDTNNLVRGFSRGVGYRADTEKEPMENLPLRGLTSDTAPRETMETMRRESGNTPLEGVSIPKPGSPSLFDMVAPGANYAAANPQAPTEAPAPTKKKESFLDRLEGNFLFNLGMNLMGSDEHEWNQQLGGAVQQTFAQRRMLEDREKQSEKDAAYLRQVEAQENNLLLRKQIEEMKAYQKSRVEALKESGRNNREIAGMFMEMSQNRMTPPAEAQAYLESAAELLGTEVPNAGSGGVRADHEPTWEDLAPYGR